MISTIPERASFTTVVVGQEIRVREGQKPNGGEAQQTLGKKNTFPQGHPTLQESPGRGEVQDFVNHLQETLKRVEPRIELSVDQELNQVVFRIVDEDTGELLRTIPSEEVLELKRFFADQSGLFVEETI